MDTIKSVGATFASWLGYCVMFVVGIVLAQAMFELSYGDMRFMFGSQPGTLFSEVGSMKQWLFVLVAFVTFTIFYCLGVLLVNKRRIISYITAVISLVMAIIIFVLILTTAIQNLFQANKPQAGYLNMATDTLACCTVDFYNLPAAGCPNAGTPCKDINGNATTVLITTLGIPAAYVRLFVGMIVVLLMAVCTTVALVLRIEKQPKFIDDSMNKVLGLLKNLQTVGSMLRDPQYEGKSEADIRRMIRSQERNMDASGLNNGDDGGQYQQLYNPVSSSSRSGSSHLDEDIPVVRRKN